MLKYHLPRFLLMVLMGLTQISVGQEVAAPEPPRTYKFSQSHKLDAELVENLGDGNSVYLVNYSASITNTSDVKFEISLWILDAFMGRVSEELETESRYMKPVGYPAGRWNPAGATEGAVIWEQVYSYGSVLGVADGNIAQPWGYILEEVELRRGGNLTGEIRPSQTLSYTDEFLVKAPTGAYIATATSYCFQRCKDNYDLYTRTLRKKLPEVSAGK